MTVPSRLFIDLELKDGANIFDSKSKSTSGIWGQSTIVCFHNLKEVVEKGNLKFFID